MLQSLSKHQGTAYALLRIFSGFLFCLHGFQKLMGAFGGLGMPIEPGSQLWFAGVIETVGGLCILLGLFTRVAAFIASGEMAVAYFQVHWKFQLDQQFFPIVNHGELPVLFCFIFLYIATHGSGKWSLRKDS